MRMERGPTEFRTVVTAMDLIPYHIKTNLCIKYKSCMFVLSVINSKNTISLNIVPLCDIGQTLVAESYCCSFVS